VGFLIYAAFQVSQRSPTRSEGIDTRCSPRDSCRIEVALVLADEPPVRRAPPAPAVPPKAPPSTQRAPSNQADAHPPAESTNSSAVAAPSESNPESTIATAIASQQPESKSGRPLHAPPGAGRTIVYVLDRSSSMAPGGKLARAVECIRLSLRELSADVHFAVVVYHGTAEALKINGSDMPVPASPQNIATAETLLKQLTAEGSSRHIEGLRKGLNLQPDELFLLTDADDLNPEHIRRVTELNRKNVAIHPVLFGTYRSGGSPFEALARKNGGKPQSIAAKP
jgi:von Willebrand factor type A domain